MMDIKLGQQFYLGQTEEENQEGYIDHFASVSRLVFLIFFQTWILTYKYPCYPELFWFLSLVGSQEFR